MVWGIAVAAVADSDLNKNAWSIRQLAMEGKSQQGAQPQRG